jgi:hypothetical protein
MQLGFCQEVCMKLRTHPLISYRGVPNWPPTWVWIDGPEESHPKGEIGIWRSVLLSKLQPANRCFLLIFHEDSSYLGCLLFDNEIFSRQITKLLQSYCNHSIAAIGSLNIPHFVEVVLTYGEKWREVVVNGEIIRAKSIIAELRLNVQRVLREEIHLTHTTLQPQSSAGRKTNNIVSLSSISEEKEPPEPPPDEDESKPPIEEPPTEEPPVKEPPPKNSS